VANNSYARGIVLTLANDTVGTGPRLQMLTGRKSVDRTIEREFALWADEVGLAEKLRTLRMARAQDGEGFGVLATNPALDHPVKLDLRPLEADRVTSPLHVADNENIVDGVKLDPHGNPASYLVLKDHPGADTWNRFQDFISIPARSMVHMFRTERPGQHRGVPEITPALPLFAQLRRFTLAVISAAEAAADFAGIVYTDTPPGGDSEPIEPMDLVELERNMLLTMPGGWKMSQIEPAQPATTYGEFKRQILNEIARCLNMPFNIAAGNSSGYNYASGRLDHQTYYKSIRVDQAFMARSALDPILAAWLWEFGVEAGFVDAVPTESYRRILPAHQWFWDGTEHVDPAKEAKAQAKRLENHTTTLAHEYARQGKDWEAELRQRAREKELQRELGLTETESLPTGEDDSDIRDRVEELEDGASEND